MVKEILRLMNSDLNLEIQNQATYEIRHQYLSAAKARKMLDWYPLFSLETGLSKTITWYKNFLEANK